MVSSMRAAKAHDNSAAPSKEAGGRTLLPRTSAPTRPPPLAAVLQRAAYDPRLLTRSDLLHLQRTIGNAAVARLLTQTAASMQTAMPVVQRYVTYYVNRKGNRRYYDTADPDERTFKREWQAEEYARKN